MEANSSSERWDRAASIAALQFPRASAQSQRVRALVFSGAFLLFVILIAAFLLVSGSWTVPALSLLALGVVTTAVGLAWATATGRIGLWSEPLEPLNEQERRFVLDCVLRRNEPVESQHRLVVREIAVRLAFCELGSLLPLTGVLIAFAGLVALAATPWLTVLFFCAGVLVFAILLRAWRRLVKARTYVRLSAIS